MHVPWAVQVHPDGQVPQLCPPRVPQSAFAQAPEGQRFAAVIHPASQVPWAGAAREALALRQRCMSSHQPHPGRAAQVAQSVAA